MRAGRLSDLVTFEARILTLNAAGQYEESWQAEARKIPADPEQFSETTCRFTIRYRRDVSPKSHRIIWNGKIWTITNAVHDRKRIDLIIDCDFSDHVEVTHLQSTQREYISTLPVIRPESD